MIFMKVLRIDREESQAQVAKGTRIRRTTIIAIENGSQRIGDLPQHEVIKLEKFFGFSAKSLGSEVNIVPDTIGTPYFFLAENIDCGGDEMTLMKYLRKETGLSQALAAIDIEISVSVLNKLENDRQSIAMTDIDVIKKLECFYRIAATHLQKIVSPHGIDALRWKEESRIRRECAGIIFDYIDKIERQDEIIKKMKEKMEQEYQDRLAIKRKRGTRKKRGR